MNNTFCLYSQKMVTLGTFVPAPHLCFLASQSISFCDLCHWQQRTACSHVQTLLAACDSAPQAVNCSCGCPYCFYEKFSGWHREKVLVPLRDRLECLSVQTVCDAVYTLVLALKAQEHMWHGHSEITRQKKKKLLLKKEDWSRECCYWSFWRLFFFFLNLQLAEKRHL